MGPVPPPFRHPFERSIFVLAVIGLVILPFALSAFGRPTLRERLRSVPYTGGDFASIEHVILDETGDLDAVVLGTSYLWAAIDAPGLEAELGQRLGRPAVVRSLGSNFRGEDMYLLLLEELLARRRVHRLVVSMPRAGEDRAVPHPYAHRVSGPGFLALYDGLPARVQAAAFGDLVLAAPRHALGLVRAERTERSPLVANNGALLQKSGFAGAAFVTWDPPPPPALPPAELAYGSRTRERFCFSGEALNEFQESFIGRVVNLAVRNDVRVFVVSIPVWQDRTEGKTGPEAWSACARERIVYPERFPGITLVGMPPRDLFGGMTEEEAKRLFYSGHMNANGARYFTRAIAPALTEVSR